MEEGGEASTDLRNLCLKSSSQQQPALSLAWTICPALLCAADSKGTPEEQLLVPLRCLAFLKPQ